LTSFTIACLSVSLRILEAYLFFLNTDTNSSELVERLLNDLLKTTEGY
jgi:hypothetical protein